MIYPSIRLFYQIHLKELLTIGIFFDQNAVGDNFYICEVVKKTRCHPAQVENQGATSRAEC